jgi:ferric-dicitrate binding protein FerR (iron transport regulator)
VTNAFDPDRDNQIARLLKLAGRRPSPGVERMQRARDAARAEWRHAMKARGRRRWLPFVAVAAMVAGVGGAAWIWKDRTAVPVNRPELATLQKVIGVVRISDAAVNGSVRTATTNASIRTADHLETGNRGGAAIRYFDGPSVRVSAGTALTLDSGSRLSLIRGTIYIDSGPQQGSNSLAVVTPLATVRHVGTQFEVQIQPGSLDVRVREGEVSIERRTERLTATAGERLLLTENHPVERRRIASSDPEWAWVTTLAPPFTLEGATVPAFLQWVSREEGLQWEYADAAARRVADRAVLHGSIDGLTPAEALLAVLPAAGLTSTRQGDRLIISAD